MSKQNRQLVIAVFESPATAQSAAMELNGWDKDSDDVKAGAIGILLPDGHGGLRQEFVGARATGKGAEIGAILGLIAAVPTAGLSLLAGAASGAAGGAVLGTFYHQQLGLSGADRERLAKDIGSGRAAVGMLVSADEAEAFRAKLSELGGVPQSHNVTDEGVEMATAAAAASATAAAAEQNSATAGTESP
jgi:uncharacterized membrane protein